KKVVPLTPEEKKVIIALKKQNPSASPAEQAIALKKAKASMPSLAGFQPTEGELSTYQAKKEVEITAFQEHQAAIKEHAKLTQSAAQASHAAMQAQAAQASKKVGVINGDVTAKERGAILDYSSSGYQNINGGLRAGD